MANDLTTSPTTRRRRPKPRREPVPPAFERQERDGQSLLSPAVEGHDVKGYVGRLMEATGSGSKAFALQAVEDLARLVDDGAGGTVQAANALVAGMAAVAPRDEVEGQLAVQMAATHHLAVRLLQDAARSDSIERQQASGNLAVKLLRAYAMQMGVLKRHRAPAQQVVRVERVEVKDGGQAIVGSIKMGAKGGGR
ncbi:MAG: hypothetical protein KDG89_06255 [Geminicoccaceae bacterium]|nr:hypothetical protein [Geminicoccaceae bacterium]